MAGYFDDYTRFVAGKGLPSPADTPYETPSFIRSKRSSRATAGGSSREQSVSPPPLPPDASDAQERSREGKFSAMDPRRFTPTLHASLVSEILNLRRELDSKNSLVENLESSLQAAKNENETISQSLSSHAREVRKAKQQVAQMEKGTYSAVEDLARERDLAMSNLEELKVKLEGANKTTRRQDEDAERTQRIWESEKESWDNERRQLERRVHVTESRLRTFVDEMTAQQATAEMQRAPVEEADESVFKDSGFGNESDTASIRSTTPNKHRRNISSISYRRSLRHSTSTRSIGTPEPHAKPGHSLADELGIDEEDEYDLDEFDHPEDDLDYNEHLRRTMESRQSSVLGDTDAKAKRILGIMSDTTESPMVSPTMKDMPKRSDEASLGSDQSKFFGDHSPGLPTVTEHISTPKVQYVDSGYQPSPPPSPTSAQPLQGDNAVPKIEEPEAETSKSAHLPSVNVAKAASIPPMSPPATPVIIHDGWPPSEHDLATRSSYSNAGTQTEHKEAERPQSIASKRDSLSPPMFVPSIAIHPPTSRPSSPRPHVLPPGTKNASAQACLPWNSRDACVQTEQIRIDKRPGKLPFQQTDDFPSSALLPSPTFEEPPPLESSRRAATGGTATIFQKPVANASIQSPPTEFPSRSADVPRSGSDKDLRSMPLRAIPLPRPVLAPTVHESDGPLNRSAQYGVTKSIGAGSQLLDVDDDTDTSDNEEYDNMFEAQDLAGSIPAFARPPHGRFGLSEPPKVVPEDKEISPERRPGTAESYGAAPAPSVASSRGGSFRAPAKPPAKLNAYKDFRSRSPSFGSVASSVQSTQSVAPPYPIPTRSSSRHPPPNAQSERSHSPTPQRTDVFGNGSRRGNGAHHHRQGSLRKVQSAAVIRNASRRASPPKSRRRRRHSPDLTPVQSMAFESPAPTDFPIPELPTPLQESLTFDYVKGSMDIGRAPTAASSMRRASEETNLVDAIAATMVGEWMWKYIRKRKSFGVQEDFPIAEDGSVNTMSHGTRHKRWVWLSPYERTIMWDNKQPTTGSALLGKKGRKLAIQSVLEVPDETPLPKDRELTSAFNRSILILTPARALKFTAVSEERHGLWMTALSFLARSGQLPSQIPPVPSRPAPAPLPPPPSDTFSNKRNRSPSFGRATVRDSIRIAKGKRPDFHKALTQPVMPAMMSGTAHEEIKNESADFPAVPRLYSSTQRHQRKRSNTSPRLPPSLSGFRSFSSTAVPSTASSGLHPGSGSSLRPSASSKSGSGSARGSSLASPDRPNFFEAVGTVRMEAFVDPNVKNGVLYVPAPPTAATAPVVRRGSNISQSISDKRRAGYVFDDYGNDPFNNF